MEYWYFVSLWKYSTSTSLYLVPLVYQVLVLLVQHCHQQFVKVLVQLLEYQYWYHCTSTLVVTEHSLTQQQIDKDRSWIEPAEDAC